MSAHRVAEILLQAIGLNVLVGLYVLGVAYLIAYRRLRALRREWHHAND